MTSTTKKRTERVLHLASLISHDCQMPVAIDIVETFLTAIVVSSTHDEDPDVLRTAQHVIEARPQISHETAVVVVKKLVEAYTARPLAPMIAHPGDCPCHVCTMGRGYRAWRDLHDQKDTLHDTLQRVEGVAHIDPFADPRTTTTDPNGNVIGHLYRGWDGFDYNVVAFRTDDGYWIEEVEHRTRTRTISVRAIGATYHHHQKCPCGWLTR